jgi:hypothetical protein
MLYFFFHRNQTIKDLRKNAGLTAKELAWEIKCETSEITHIDHQRLKDIPRAMRDRLLPIFRGDRMDKIPW